MYVKNDEQQEVLTSHSDLEEFRKWVLYLGNKALKSVWQIMKSFSLPRALQIRYDLRLFYMNIIPCEF